MKKKLLASSLIFAAFGITLPSYSSIRTTNWDILENKAEAEYNLQKYSSYKHMYPNVSAPRVHEDLFDQKLDQKDLSDTRTFKQRYWTYSSDSAGPNSPVFYFICGESRCKGIQPYHFYYDLANKFNGHAVALEHRYYGDSQAFDTLTPDTLKYLSTEAALQDLANFQTHLMKENSWNGPWISIGGSYAGSLSAYYRLMYPHLVVGALASSAPVEAKANFEEYDASVQEGLPIECLTDIRKAYKQVEHSFDNPEEMEKIKSIFETADIKNKINFLFGLADMASAAVQYGGTKQFCETLNSAENLLESYAHAGKAAIFGGGILDGTFEGFELVDTKDNANGMRQWGWQFCKEYGYYQVAHSNPELSMRSALISTEFHDQECKRLFGLDPVDTAKTNKKYFEPLLDKLREPVASHIFFTNGSTDPWKELSITTERRNNINPLFSYYTIQDAAHCEDFYTASKNPYVRQAQAQFELLVKSWIEDFKN